ncbi:TlpA family protein disulfide reductase [Ferruginibacter sp. SUN106]|uniref:TlpA family protein disulfide reductase n=1 Tax=Ferruginibacter sp. SUN106 TaxID=2978348 RepID=UPI003D35EE5B
MKGFYCLILFLCPLLNNAQTSQAPLPIGSKLPPLQFKAVLNAPYKTTSLNAHNTKLILVDFWATWCASCIREFPKLDTLQQQFKDSLQVLLVNNPKSGDDQKRIIAFFNRNRYTLPVIYKDEQLARLFPHKAIPHTVWINKGVVIAITGPDEVNAQNIRAALQGNTTALALKSDQLDFDQSKLLLEQGNGGSIASLVIRSSIIRYLSGAGTGVGFSILPGNIFRRYFLNQPLIRLYALAFPAIAGNRMVLENGLDTTLLGTLHTAAWKSTHCFSYELLVPQFTPVEKMQVIMRQDLDRQFNLSAAVQKRIIDCYAIIKLQGVNTANDYLPAKDTGFFQDAQGFWCLHNKPVRVLVNKLNTQSPGTPLKPVVLDETGYTLPVSVNFSFTDLTNFYLLKQALRPLGFDIISCKRELEVLVISKN